MYDPYVGINSLSDTNQNYRALVTYRPVRKLRHEQYVTAEPRFHAVILVSNYFLLRPTLFFGHNTEI